MKEKQEKNSHSHNSNLQHLALATTRYIGSVTSLVIHSIFFVGIFSLQWFGFNFDQIMLILTTVVSLEAIYLAIFIQMTVNRQAHELAEISEDVEDISEDVEDITEEMEKEDEEMAQKHKNDQEKIQHIEGILKELLTEVRDLKDKQK